MPRLPGMVYVALLRGINVGGNHKVEMPRLKVVFEGLGLRDVVTYINSGNVIFRKDDAEVGNVGDIERAIETEFGFLVPVVVRSRDQIMETSKAINSEWLNNAEMKTDVMFLWDEIDSPDLLKSITIRPEVESLVYTPGALVWNVDRQHISNGAVIELAKGSLYKKMTIRNCNTVRKLLTMME